MRKMAISRHFAGKKTNPICGTAILAVFSWAPKPMLHLLHSARLRHELRPNVAHDRGQPLPPIAAQNERDIVSFLRNPPECL